MNIDKILELDRRAEKPLAALEHHKAMLVKVGVVFDPVALYDLEEAVSDIVGCIDERN